MPVKITAFSPMSDEEFESLRWQRQRKTNPALDELLHEVAAGQAMRVPLVDGQTARGLRVAISRAANARGLHVETLEGDGFVAVKQTEEPRPGRRESSRGDLPRRRGRPPKQD